MIRSHDKTRATRLNGRLSCTVALRPSASAASATTSPLRSCPLLLPCRCSRRGRTCCPPLAASKLPYRAEQHPLDALNSLRSPHLMPRVRRAQQCPSTASNGVCLYNTRSRRSTAPVCCFQCRAFVASNSAQSSRPTPHVRRAQRRTSAAVTPMSGHLRSSPTDATDLRRLRFLRRNGHHSVGPFGTPSDRRAPDGSR
jgi:hypothetical protein